MNVKLIKGYVNNRVNDLKINRDETNYYNGQVWARKEELNKLVNYIEKFEKDSEQQEHQAPKFELNQKVNLMYLKMVVPSVITKRIKVENIDTGAYEYYYDYKHDIPSGYSFSQIDEEHLLENYREALRIGIEKIVSKK